MENNNIETTDVHDSCTLALKYEDFVQMYKKCVHELIEQRHDADFTQQFMADWLEVDRRKIISFEQCEQVDIEFLFRYAEKFADVNVMIALTKEDITSLK